MKDKTTCNDCYNNKFSPGMKAMYSKKVPCLHCKKIIGHRKPSKKEQEKDETKKEI